MKNKTYDVLTSQKGMKFVKKTSQVEAPDRIMALKRAKRDNPGSLYVKVKLSK